MKHILGAAAHAARAAELVAGDDRAAGIDHIEQARRRPSPIVVDVLSRYLVAPPGGGRVGELLRDLAGPSAPFLMASWCLWITVTERELISKGRRQDEGLDQGG